MGTLSHTSKLQTHLLQTVTSWPALGMPKQHSSQGRGLLRSRNQAQDCLDREIWGLCCLVCGLKGDMSLWLWLHGLLTMRRSMPVKDRSRAPLKCETKVRDTFLGVRTVLSVSAPALGITFCRWAWINPCGAPPLPWSHLHLPCEWEMQSSCGSPESTVS